MTRQEAIALGALGLDVPTVGLRTASLGYLRAGGSATGAITVAYYANGTRHIVDGRHRILVAREQGKTHVVGRLIGYGPRLGLLWKFEGRFPV